ncbi:MAG: hypothetical protein IGS49_22095 [Chlorogloeopsis fritschii C42_A2020_084]|jgi:hypothetical protein|uniref:hypothetical protein n=1 Tax=Chlorogloeopsis fritschii TaxID=1124 RepID=UPI001A08BE2B|nr:hypothetical protein [Chlorogloeopsis fritschii]MBF2008059.1 hypothetical protein [Chlorogloeopsis fritschii C42_A2020_084]
MNFFNNSVPPLRRKQAVLDIHELEGSWQVDWRIGKVKIYSTYYTRLDRAFILWALLLVPMFATAQFLPVSWDLQATVWSILSIIGTAIMVILTQYWVKRRQVNWVLYCWVALMLLGVILTDFGVFFSWTEVLINLCPLWLGLSALGYLCTGLGVRSRTLIVTGIIHLLGIFFLPFFTEWQFIYTGAVMVLCLLMLAEFEWDHQ